MAGTVKAASRLPLRRGLNELEAGVYLGIAVAEFRRMTLAGTMPRARRIGLRRVWDVDALDAAFQDLPLEGSEQADTWGDFRNGCDKAQAR